MATETQKLSEGKTKILYPHTLPSGETGLRVMFKDRATAFNAEKVAEVSGKGAINTNISAQLFELLEKEGIQTCYVQKGPAENELIFRTLTMITVEVVVRNDAYGSLCKRFPQFKQGDALVTPMVEYFLKDDAAGDPSIPPAVITALGLLPKGVTFEQLERQARKINDIVFRYYASLGIRVADFKLEFGVDAKGKLCLGDEMSPDNFRLRDMKTGQVLDKDVFRFDLADLGETYRSLMQRIDAGSTTAVETKTQTYTAAVKVQYRPEILHPESRTILDALHTMGYGNVQTLRAGKSFEISLTAGSFVEAEKQLAEMADRVLSNPVIEGFEVTTLTIQ